MKVALRIVTISLTFLSTISYGEPFRFALIGDLPYHVDIEEDNADISALIKELNNQPDLSWVLHVGDIKKGLEPCSNEFFLDRKKRFEKISHDFILTPGDNDWTDCHNLFAGNYDPFERLDFLRKAFFSGENHKSHINALEIFQQPTLQPHHAAYIENYAWQKNAIHFATIHIVGSRDGTKPISRKEKSKISIKQKTLTKQRQSAAVDWLEWVFKNARKKNAAGLFIAIHANPGWDLRYEKKDRPVFRYFTTRLERLVSEFDAPVVVAHGDTHTFRVDKPQIDQKAAPANFTRVESFGENNRAWVEVRVDPSSESVFSFIAHDK